MALFLRCMNQPGNSVSFGTPLTLKSFYHTTASYKITCKLEQNPCHSSIGSANLNRTLATTWLFSMYNLAEIPRLKSTGTTRISLFSTYLLLNLSSGKNSVTARIFLVSTYHLLNVSSGSNSAAEIHREILPSLNLSSSRADLLQSKQREIIISDNLNRSQNPCHNNIGSVKISLILLIIRWFEKAQQAGGRRTNTFWASLQRLKRLKRPKIQWLPLTGYKSSISTKATISAKMSQNEKIHCMKPLVRIMFSTLVVVVWQDWKAVLDISQDRKAVLKISRSVFLANI